MTGDSRANDIARELSKYFDDHPDASDTLDGIARWWLASDVGDDAKLTVLLALERLVEAGAVEKRVLADGTTLFRRRD